MNDLISRKALIAEYDRVHIGEAGNARKLIENAPAVDVPHWATEQAYKNGYEAGKRDAYKLSATKTNADRIRAMSDGELAESLSKTVVDAICYSHSAEKQVDKTPKEIWDDLVKEYLEWLKQPAEE